jgi:hypothetical protein
MVSSVRQVLREHLGTQPRLCLESRSTSHCKRTLQRSSVLHCDFRKRVSFDNSTTHPVNIVWHAETGAQSGEQVFGVVDLCGSNFSSVAEISDLAPRRCVSRARRNLPIARRSYQVEDVVNTHGNLPLSSSIDSNRRPWSVCLARYNPYPATSLASILGGRASALGSVTMSTSTGPL